MLSMPGSIMEYLKKNKQEKSLLKGIVLDWITENTYRLEHYTEEDFSILHQLMVVGTTRDRRVFSPSGFTACQRKQVIDKIDGMRSKIVIDPQLQLIFDDGNWRHLRWQMLFYKMGIVESMEEFKSEGDLELGGSLDIKIVLRIRNKKMRIIVDIKGINASGWQHVSTTGKPPMSHVVQLRTYMMLHGIMTGVLWYEDKNTNRIYEFIIKASDKWEKSIRKRAARMKTFAAAQAFPRYECRVLDPKDRMFATCSQAANCVLLPVHQIVNGKIIKIADPIRKTIIPLFVKLNSGKIVKENISPYSEIILSRDIK